MKKFLGVLLVSVMIANTVSAQIVDVVSMKRVPTEAGFFPTISPQGDYLLVSNAGFVGLSKVDLATNETTVISTAPSAGYFPSISPDGKRIAFREDSYDMGQRRFVSVKSVDFSKSKKEVVEEIAPTREFTGMRMSNGSLKMAHGRKEMRRRKGTKEETGEPPLIALEENGDVLVPVIYRDGVRTVFAPNGENKSYLWPSLSPDGKKMVYTVTIPEVCTYVCDIEGKNPVRLGKLNTPQWLGNRCIIGMNDQDDGHEYTASSVDIVTIDGKKRQTLTPSSMIAMYPTASADGKTVSFHTGEGEIYVVKLNFKNN